MTRITALFAAAAVLLPIPAAAGGKACQIADSAVPTPGLRELTMGSTSNPVPDNARLTGGQIEALAEADTQFRRALREIDEKVAKLPAKEKNAAADLAGKPLPELVTAFLARAARGRAILIDPEAAREFTLADAKALAARKAGEKDRFCPLCIAVREGMEAPFRWDAAEFGELTAQQTKELAELGQERDDLVRKWEAVLQNQLTAPQLEWLREAQMRWLKETLRTAVTEGLTSLGVETCKSCADLALPKKCEFCSIVTNALEEARRQ